MLKLKRETDLGLLLMESLAELPAGGHLSLLVWAKDRNLPYRFLSKVAGRLKQSGLVRAKEGKSGGYGLARSAAKISLAEIITALEGKKALTACGSRSCSSRSFCRHRQLMSRLSTAVKKELSRVSLAGLYAKY